MFHVTRRLATTGDIIPCFIININILIHTDLNKINFILCVSLIKMGVTLCFFLFLSTLKMSAWVDVSLCAWVRRRSSLRHMFCAHALWRPFQRVYALRLCSVKVVIAGICLAFMLRGGRLAWNMFSCCETTSKVAVSRQAYTPLTFQWKRDDLQSRYYVQSICLNVRKEAERPSTHLCAAKRYDPPKSHSVAYGRFKSLFLHKKLFIL
jgi:hypothetical protein